MSFLKNKLHNIQNSGDDEKKKWLVILSGISMVIVILAWIFYMNNFVMKATPLQADEKVEMDIGFWQVFKTGLSVIENRSSEKIKTGFNYMLDKIPMFGKNSVTIENPK